MIIMIIMIMMMNMMMTILMAIIRTNFKVGGPDLHGNRST